MSRTIGFLWACAVMLSGALANGQEFTGALVPAHVAERHGLHRAWVAQAEVGRDADRLTYISLWPAAPARSGQVNHDLLLVQTAKGAIHAIDAETGETLWIERVGKSTLVTNAAAANDWCVVVCNGTRLYVLNRTNGALMFDRELIGGAPSAGTTLSAMHAYVPMINGSVVSYVLRATKRKISRSGSVEEALEGEDESDESASDSASSNDGDSAAKNSKRPKVSTSTADETVISLTPDRTPPQRYVATAPPTGAPVVSRGSVAWGTTKGDVYSTSTGRMQANFRFRTGKRISAPLVGLGNYVIAASRDGDVFAIQANMGTAAWTFTTGRAIHHQPVVVGDSVFVLPERGGMHCIELITGQERWHARRAAEFLAASTSRVYAFDASDTLLILNANSGAVMDSLALHHVDLSVVNSRHDRIYIASNSGMVQCLRETALESPTLHSTPGDVAPGSNLQAERKAREAAAAKAAEESGDEDAGADADDDESADDDKAAEDSSKDDSSGEEDSQDDADSTEESAE